MRGPNGGQGWIPALALPPPNEAQGWIPAAINRLLNKERRLQTPTPYLAQQPAAKRRGSAALRFV
ncbi:MAG: hypothetical protein A2W26_00505 [Acidobacteria bacterium RBG_16_64_8]|nr:MAG: hypothetical protein A2W26_00505 [Acidobacteria bacterium RBG_16_64_8]